MTENTNLVDLTTDAIEKGANAAEEIHRSIAAFPFDLIEQASAFEQTLADVRRIQERSIRAIYDLVRGVNHEVGKVAHALIDAPRPPVGSRKKAA
jgi:uncharacterized NAD-dependent epimerase/dehydratase family protein